MNDEFGNRYNNDKPRMDLLPWDVLWELGHVYRIGALKYSDRNWERGLEWNKGCAASLARHLASWGQGEDFTVENIGGVDHKLYHDLAMVWNAMALVRFRLHGVGTDDRPRVQGLGDGREDDGRAGGKVPGKVIWIE